MSSYDGLGIRRVINASATLTRLGGSLMPPSVVSAMSKAAGSFIDLTEVHAKVGERIAAMTNNEACYISSGAAAGIAVAVAACITGTNPGTNQLAGLTIQDQTRQALVNCENILHAAGAKLENVVEVYVLLARPNDFAGLNEEYAKFFPTDPPTRAVAKLGVELPNVLVSIKMTAVL